ncbi:unnamed protein product [Bemisia tabaci]|uniref:Uncharacterized protein n=1 Tax=Bemisia tabaci TaxID=7038 RepID=A0A9P0AIQ3_BEMTA|nr:unnamed protein product [Bemisia tabaci]
MHRFLSLHSGQDERSFAALPNFTRKAAGLNVRTQNMNELSERRQNGEMTPSHPPTNGHGAHGGPAHGQYPTPTSEIPSIMFDVK